MSRQQRLKDTIREARDLIAQGLAVERNQARLEQATQSLENLREYMREYQRKRRPAPVFKNPPEVRQARTMRDNMSRPLGPLAKAAANTAAGGMWRCKLCPDERAVVIPNDNEALITLHLQWHKDND